MDNKQTTTALDKEFQSWLEQVSLLESERSTQGCSFLNELLISKPPEVPGATARDFISCYSGFVQSLATELLARIEAKKQDLDVSHSISEDPLLVTRLNYLLEVGFCLSLSAFELMREQGVLQRELASVEAAISENRILPSRKEFIDHDAAEQQMLEVDFGYTAKLLLRYRCFIADVSFGTGIESRFFTDTMRFADEVDSRLSANFTRQKIARLRADHASSGLPSDQSAESRAAELGFLHDFDTDSEANKAYRAELKELHVKHSANIMQVYAEKRVRELQNPLMDEAQRAQSFDEKTVKIRQLEEKFATDREALLNRYATT